jgi:hypothetical protein
MELFLTMCVVVALMGAIVYLSDYLRRRSSFTVMEFQRAVFYVNGLPQQEIGPGTHRVLLGRDYVVYADVRPKTINVENQGVGLRDGLVATYNFYAVVYVEDIRKLLYGARNHYEIPYYVLRKVVRSTLWKQTRLTLLGSGKNAIEGTMRQQAAEELAACGMKLDEFKLSNLSIGMPKAPEPTKPSIEPLVN